MAPLELNSQVDICADTGCSKTLRDRTFIKKNFPLTDIRHFATSLTVKGIGNGRHQTTQYVIIPLQFLGSDTDSKPAIAEITTEVALVDDSLPNILMGVWGLTNSTSYFPSNMRSSLPAKRFGIPFATVKIGRPHQSKVTTTGNTTVKRHSVATLAVQHSVHQDDGQDLIFEPDIDARHRLGI